VLLRKLAFSHDFFPFLAERPEPQTHWSNLTQTILNENINLSKSPNCIRFHLTFRLKGTWRLNVNLNMSLKRFYKFSGLITFSSLALIRHFESYTSFWLC